MANEQSAEITKVNPPMTPLNTIIEEEKPDFHMMALAKSECAKDAGELTVVRLGYVTRLLEDVYTTAMQRAYEAGRAEERERIEDAFASESKYIEDFVPNEYGTETINTSHYLIYEGDWKKVITPLDTILSKITHKTK